MGFLGGSDGKASAHNAGDPDSIPGWGRSPGEGNGNLLQYSCLENSMNGGAWWATVHGRLQCRRPRFNPQVGKIPWGRKWHPTPVLLPGKFHGWRSLVGYSASGCKDSDKQRKDFHSLLQRIFLTQRSNTLSLTFPALAGRFFTTSAIWEAL